MLNTYLTSLAASQYVDPDAYDPYSGRAPERPQRPEPYTRSLGFGPGGDSGFGMHRVYRPSEMDAYNREMEAYNQRLAAFQQAQAVQGPPPERAGSPQPARPANAPAPPAAPVPAPAAARPAPEAAASPPQRMNPADFTVDTAGLDKLEEMLDEQGEKLAEGIVQEATGQDMRAVAERLGLIGSEEEEDPDKRPAWRRRLLEFGLGMLSGSAGGSLQKGFAAGAGNLAAGLRQDRQDELDMRDREQARTAREFSVETQLMGLEEAREERAYQRERDLVEDQRALRRDRANLEGARMEAEEAGRGRAFRAEQAALDRQSQEMSARLRSGSATGTDYRVLAGALEQALVDAGLPKDVAQTQGRIAARGDIITLGDLEQAADRSAQALLKIDGETEFTDDFAAKYRETKERIRDSMIEAHPLREYFLKQLGRGAQNAAPSPEAPGEYAPAPPNATEGQRFRGSDGRVYRAQNGLMVPE
jgi:hypothetical protein